eukprot:jgi/Astpho2/1467/fgenesh1_pm.00026_%23_1_t
MGIWAGEQAQRSKRHTASKYDFIKVKVWLGETQAHYYILSRFLISRMLTVTKIPYMKAVKIALEVKKYLVDGNHFDITQGNLEEILFHIMSNKGYGEEYVKRYKMVTAFHQQRRPLIILLCGAPCTGKSSMAQQLASRLNMPNVLQTDIICELLRMDPHHHGPLHGPSLWSDEAGLSGDALIAQFQRECHVVRKGLEGDLAKTVKDGKSIIIEGFHLDPGLYLSANNSVPTGNQSTNKSIESPKDSNSPVFVPIVLAMEESDHRVLIQEWHARQLDRLCRYAQRDVPVVHVSIASFPTVLDKLHDYLLKCIEVAMQGS